MRGKGGSEREGGTFTGMTVLYQEGTYVCMFFLGCVCVSVCI